MNDDDPRDPYILGRPMGWKAGVIFLTIMLVLPTIAVMLGYHHEHLSDAPNQSCKARGMQPDSRDRHLCWLSLGGGRFAPVEI